MNTTLTTLKLNIKTKLVTVVLLVVMGFSTVVDMSVSLLLEFDSIEVVDILDGELELDEKKETEKKIFEVNKIPVYQALKINQKYTSINFDFPDSIPIEGITPPPRHV